MSWFKRFFPPPSKIFTEEDYQTAYQFKDAFEPKPDHDYSWVAEYARFTFDQFQHADDTLDKKAESIMRVLGGGSGLLSLGAVLNLSKIGNLTSLVIAIGLLLALSAVAIAAWVRVPRNTLLPPSIAWALQYVDAYEKQSHDRFLAQWHLACEGMRLSIRAKAWGVKVATWLGVASVTAVAISFFVAFATISIGSELELEQGNQSMNQPSQENADSQSATPNATSSSSPAPDPSGVPQTPTPHSAAGPQVIQRTADPASASGPQTIQFSEDTATQDSSSDNGNTDD